MRTNILSMNSDNFFVRKLNQQIAQFESASYGMMGFYLTLQSCLGGIACMFLLQSYVPIWVMMPCAIITMMCNAFLISQASTKWSVILFDLSIIINTFYIIAYNI